MRSHLNRRSRFDPYPGHRRRRRPGAVARYGLTGLLQRFAGPIFPLGTLAVNVLGCFMLGLMATLSLERWFLNPITRPALLIGFLGAFTTFSAFSYETLALLREGAAWRSALNIGLSVALCLAAAWGGVVLAERVCCLLPLYRIGGVDIEP